MTSSWLSDREKLSAMFGRHFFRFILCNDDKCLERLHVSLFLWWINYLSWAFSWYELFSRSFDCVCLLKGFININHFCLTENTKAESFGIGKIFVSLEYLLFRELENLNFHRKKMTLVEAIRLWCFLRDAWLFCENSSHRSTANAVSVEGIFDVSMHAWSNNNLSTKQHFQLDNFLTQLQCNWCRGEKVLSQVIGRWIYEAKSKSWLCCSSFLTFFSRWSLNRTNCWFSNDDEHTFDEENSKRSRRREKNERKGKKMKTLSRRFLIFSPATIFLLASLPMRKYCYMENYLCHFSCPTSSKRTHVRAYIF